MQLVIFLVCWMDGGLIEACTWFALFIGLMIPSLLSSRGGDFKWRQLSWAAVAGCAKKPQTPSFALGDVRSGQTLCLPDDAMDQRKTAEMVLDKFCDGPEAPKHRQENHNGMFLNFDGRPPEAVKVPVPAFPKISRVNAGPTVVPESVAASAMQQLRIHQQEPKAVPEAWLPSSANIQRICGIPSHVKAEMLRQRLDMSGLLGAYDWFWMPVDPETGLSNGEAFINLVHVFYVAMLKSTLAEPPFWGELETTSSAAALSLRPLTKQIINQRTSETPKVTEVETETHSQLHKTKLCIFYAKNRCRRGTACAFAHSHAELQAPPDLFKTKPCYKFCRHQCNDANCKYAHGIEELRTRKFMGIAEQSPGIA